MTKADQQFIKQHIDALGRELGQKFSQLLKRETIQVRKELSRFAARTELDAKLDELRTGIESKIEAEVRGLARMTSKEFERVWHELERVR